MKHGKGPTRKEKEILIGNGLNFNEWLVVRKEDFTMQIENKATGIVKRVSIFPKKINR
jgi:hypothetical protein